MNLPARFSPTTLRLLYRLSCLLALLLLLTASGARAERKTVALGLVGGITGASFWGDEVHSYDVEIWPTTGFTLAFHLPVFLGLGSFQIRTNIGSETLDKTKKADVKTFTTAVMAGFIF